MLRVFTVKVGPLQSRLRFYTSRLRLYTNWMPFWEGPDRPSWAAGKLDILFIFQSVGPAGPVWGLPATANLDSPDHGFRFRFVTRGFNSVSFVTRGFNSVSFCY